jgi:hypothetical protein
MEAQAQVVTPDELESTLACAIRMGHIKDMQGAKWEIDRMKYNLRSDNFFERLNKAVMKEGLYLTLHHDPACFKDYFVLILDVPF